MKREYIGSDFDDFLKQDDLLAKCEAGALKRVVAWQIDREMKVNFPRQTRQPHRNPPARLERLDSWVTACRRESAETAFGLGTTDVAVVLRAEEPEQIIKVSGV